MKADGLKAGAIHGLAALLVGLMGVLLVLGPDPGWTLTQLPGYDNPDQWGAIYLHHHHHESVAAGRWPGFDAGQMVPEGLPLTALHGGNTMEMWVSLLVRQLLGWPAWFTWAHLVWIPLLVLAFQPLGWQLWHRRGPALAAGLAWALWPFHLGELEAGRLTQVALVGLPLATAGLLRLGAGSTRVAGPGLALTALGYWFYGLFMVILSPVFVASARWEEGRGPREVTRAFLQAGLVALMLVSPWLLLALWPRLTGDWVPDPGGGPGGAAAVFDMALKLEGPQPRTARAWWPWVLLPGMACTLVWGHRRFLWTGLAGLSVLFALGPATRFAGMDWHLPYELLWGVVPMLSRLNHPVRWLGVAGLFCVVLAMDGVARRAPRGAWLLPVGVAAHLWWTGLAPLRHHPEEIPEHWTAVDRVAAQGAVIVLPIGGAAESIRALHLHRRPLLGGMVEGLVWARPPTWTQRISQNSFLAQLALVTRGGVSELVLVDGDVQEVRNLGFRTIVLDLDLVRRSPSGTPVAARRVLTQSLGPPLYDDGKGVIWHVPTHGSVAHAPSLPAVWEEP